MGMSSPSIHTIGSLLSLPWSCQVQDGVMTKSPGDMIVLLAIDRGVAPLPSTMKRSADCVAVRRRHLARKDELQAGIERVSDLRLRRAVRDSSSTSTRRSAFAVISVPPA